MELVLVLKELEKNSVALELLDSGKLKYSAPEGALDDNLKGLILEHKEQIIAHLAAPKRLAKVKGWPIDLQAAHEHLLRRLMRVEGDDRAKAEERAFVYLKRPAAFLLARAEGVRFEEAAQVFER